MKKTKKSYLSDVIGQTDYKTKLKHFLAHPPEAFAATLRGKSGVGKSFLAEAFAKDMKGKGYETFIIDQPSDVPSLFDDLFRCVTNTARYVLVINEAHKYASGSESNAASRKLMAFLHAAYSSSDPKRTTEIVKPGNLEAEMGYKGIVLLTSYLAGIQSASKRGSDCARRFPDWILSDYNTRELGLIAERMGYKRNHSYFSHLIKACRYTAEALINGKKSDPDLTQWGKIESQKDFLLWLRQASFYPHGLRPDEAKLLQRLSTIERAKRRKLREMSQLDAMALGESILYLEEQGLVSDVEPWVTITPKGKVWVANVFERNNEQ